MPDTWIPWWTPFGTRKLRAYNKGVEGNELIVIPSSRSKISAQVMASTFRIPGLASADHDILRWENAAGSSILMALRELKLNLTHSAVRLNVIQPSANIYKVTSSLATGGTASTKHVFDSNDSSSASAIFAGAASAEGTASAITWTTAGGTPAWRQFLDNRETSVAQNNPIKFDLLPEACRFNPIILRAGQQIVVSINIAALTTDHYVLMGMWDEFTLP